MFIKKIIYRVMMLTALSGCVQNTAFLGPALTGASTGNAYQAGLSYSTNIVVKKITGRTPVENFQELLTLKKSDNKIIKSLKKNLKKHDQGIINSKKKNNKFIKLSIKTIEKESLEFYTLVTNLYLQDQSN
jgi:hypothetical protein